MGGSRAEASPESAMIPTPLTSACPRERGRGRLSLLQKKPRDERAIVALNASVRIIDLSRVICAEDYPNGL